MMYNFNGKSIRIPDAEISANMKLGISEEEAIQMWLEDNEYELNEEQVALNTKAKESGIRIQAQGEKSVKKTQRERVKKDDPTKENIIAGVAEFLSSMPGAANIKIENKGKLITFSIGDENFKFDLIRSRIKKD